MKDPSHGDGTVQVLLDRLNNWRLPRALAMKDRVDKGEKLDENDLKFMAAVFQDSNQLRTMISRHPEYQPLANKMIDLYSHITQKALENEQST